MKKVTIANWFPVTSFEGEKHIVFGTTTWLGGKNYGLAWTYIIVSCVSIILAVAFGIRLLYGSRFVIVYLCMLMSCVCVCVCVCFVLYGCFCIYLEVKQRLISFCNFVFFRVFFFPKCCEIAQKYFKLTNIFLLCEKKGNKTRQPFAYSHDFFLVTKCHFLKRNESMITCFHGFLIFLRHKIRK